MTDKAPVKEKEEELQDDNAQTAPLDDQSPAQASGAVPPPSDPAAPVAEEAAPVAEPTAPIAQPTAPQTDGLAQASPATPAPAPQSTLAEPAPSGLAVGPKASPMAVQPAPAAEAKEDANTVDVLGTRPPAQNALQAFAQNMAFQQDLAQGKITPKTYHDLFAEKSTLGKIGTLFGMVLSGAGSALAHQPDMILDMMNKEIERDLEAQKLNQSNKQSWYNAAMAHEKSLADIATNAATEQSIRMGTFNSALDAEHKNYRNKVIPGLERLAGTVNSANDMSSAALQFVQDTTNRLAPGPRKQSGQNFIDNDMRPAVNALNMKRQEELAQRKDAIHKLYPNPLKKALEGPVDPRVNAIDENKLQQAITLGRAAPGTPGSIPEQQVPTINAEINKVKTNRNVYADWADTFQKIQKMKLAGQAPGAKVATSVLGMFPFMGEGAAHAGDTVEEALTRARDVEANSFVERVGKGLSDEAKAKLGKSLLPAWNDDDHTKEEAWRKGVQHFKTLEADTANLDQYGLKSKFPELPYKTIKEEAHNSKKSEDKSSETKSSNSIGDRADKANSFLGAWKKRFMDGG